MTLTRIATALAVLLTVITITVGCTTSFKHKRKDLLTQKYNPQAPNDEEVENGIIRLKNENGEFFCTGFVIDDNYAMTAAHCVVDSVMGVATLREAPITVANVENKDMEDKALAAGLNVRQDFAIIKGNFKKFKKLKIDSSNPPILRTMFPIYKSCGFPMGQKQLVCIDVLPSGNEYFHIIGIGQESIYPGMSGGPLVDLERNTVIAVNSYVGQGYMAFGPIIGALADFGIE